MAAGRIKVGPLTTPWVANGMLRIDGTEHRLGGFDRIAVDEGRRTADELRVRDLRQGREAPRPGRARSRATSSPGSTRDPKGPEHNTLNCSISDLELDVERDGRPAAAARARPARAAYEIGMRDTDHGIPVQPYPDG